MGWEEFKWLITCLIMAAPVIQNAINSGESKLFKQASMASDLVRPRRLSTTDRLTMDLTKQVLSELELHILNVASGKEMLTTLTVSRIRDAKLSESIAALERELVSCGLLSEPAGVSYYLGVLLLLPFTPMRHKTAEDLGMFAMRQALAARDLWEAIQRLRQAIGPVRQD